MLFKSYKIKCDLNFLIDLIIQVLADPIDKTE